MKPPSFSKGRWYANSFEAVAAATPDLEWQLFDDLRAQVPDVAAPLGEAGLMVAEYRSGGVVVVCEPTSYPPRLYYGTYREVGWPALIEAWKAARVAQSVVNALTADPDRYQSVRALLQPTIRDARRRIRAAA